jgi:hypothetical protein
MSDNDTETFEAGYLAAHPHFADSIKHSGLAAILDINRATGAVRPVEDPLIRPGFTAPSIDYGKA